MSTITFSFEDKSIRKGFFANKLKDKTIEYNLDEILDKINQQGLETLTLEEKNFLDDISKT